MIALLGWLATRLRIDVELGALAIQYPAACDHDEDPDVGMDVRYLFHGDTLWSVLEDAAIAARNGSSPQEAADAVMAQLELRHTEAGE